MNTKSILAAALATASLLAGCNRAPQDETVSKAPAAPPASAPVTRVEPAPTDGAGALARAVPRDATTDSGITARVKTGILSDPGMAASDVSVNTDRGVVTLTGMVKSQEQAAIASAHAQRQDGVMRVENHLAVNLQ
jgi:hypothetical protein